MSTDAGCRSLYVRRRGGAVTARVARVRRGDAALSPAALPHAEQRDGPTARESPPGARRRHLPPLQPGGERGGSADVAERERGGRVGDGDGRREGGAVADRVRGYGGGGGGAGGGGEVAPAGGDRRRRTAARRM